MWAQNYGEHGRELITVEVALRLLAALADPGPAIERSVQRGHSPHLLKNLLHSSVFKARCPIDWCVAYKCDCPLVLPVGC